MFRILIILIISFNITYSQDYYLYVAAESDDTVSLLNFDGNNLSEIERIVVGSYPTENEGPHGLTVCLLYTSPSPRDRQKSRMPSSA